MMQKREFYLLVILSLIFFLGCESENSKTDVFEERTKIALREVGNQLLLSKKDSTSLILPVLKITKNEYHLSFEKPLGFEPNTLVAIVKESFHKIGFQENYLVEVIDCETKVVGYSYEIKNDTEKDIIPCAGRLLPENCYQIRFKFLYRKQK